MPENKADKRIIAIAVSPRAYDEILKLKGERTWTKWLLELMSIENPTNEVLTDELLELVKPKTEKPKTQPKPKKEKAKVAVEAEAEVIAKAVEAEAEIIEVIAKAVEAEAEPAPEVEFGKVDPCTGGTPIDIRKIGKNKKVEVEA